MAEGDAPRKRVAVLGGGSSGLVSIKACLEEGYEVTCYEMQSTLGGLWRYRDDDTEGLASVMKSTIINSSKEMSAFSDFPPPTEYPNYMHNSMMVKYVELYAEKFNLAKHILFRHEVIKVVQAKDYDSNGRWTVKLRELDTNNEFQEDFDGVMVCTGHHVYPHFPKMEGLDLFKGRVLHTHSYKRPTGFEDKKVVIVGVGNSGGDVAVELSHVCDKVYLSTRRGCWMLHRVGPDGLPFDAAYLRRSLNVLWEVMPYKVSCFFCERLIEKQRFDHSTYNLKPKHRIFAQHPMVNDALPNRILSGTVVVKSDVERFTPNGVVFQNEDGVEHECDTVVLATGYTCKFPYIDEDLFDPEGNRCELYKYVFPPHLKHPSLCFIGLAQPVGPLFPISESQARWYVQCLAGNVRLPSEEAMMKDVRAKAEEMSKRYFGGPRHTIQVDWLPYMDEIAEQYGAKPDLVKLFFTDPKLFWTCFWGPCLPYQYRLDGPRPWAGARRAIMEYDGRVMGAFDTRKRAEKTERSPRDGSRFVGFLVLVLAVSVAVLLPLLF